MNFINVDNLYYAVCTKDDATGATYQAPKAIPGSVKIAVQPETGKQPFYSDGIITEYGQVTTQAKLSLDVSTVPLTTQADLLGHTLDGMGGIISKVTDISPYVALFYRRKKSNGKYRYMKLLKCIFAPSKEDAETTTNNVKFQNDTFEGVAMGRIYDKQWKRMSDEEEVGYIDVSATWFTTVDGVADITPPTIVSTIPASAATAVAISTTYQWVFSESINPSTININNFYLIKDTDGTTIPGTAAYVDATKTVTFTPTSVLSAATKYIAIADGDVADLAGNKLVISAKYFTTA